MGLKQDAELIRDRTSRILVIFAKAERYKDQGQIFIDNNPDLPISIDQATKDGWRAQMLSLQSGIKTIVAGW